MARDGYTGTTLKEGWMAAIDDYREQFRYPPSRAEVIYEALAPFFENETDLDLRDYLTDEDIDRFLEEG